MPREGHGGRTRIWLAGLLCRVAALWLPGSVGAAPLEPIAGPVVVRIHYADAESLAILVDTVDIWEIDRCQGSVVALLNGSAETDRLVAAGYRVALEPQQMAQIPVPRLRLPGQAAGNPGYSCYRTIDETYADLARVAAELRRAGAS